MARFWPPATPSPKSVAAVWWCSNGSQATPNQVGAWVVDQGTLEVRGSNGASDMLGTGATVTLNGATLNARFDGDSTAVQQDITTIQSNNFIIGSTIPVSSANYVGSTAADTISAVPLSTTPAAAQRKTVVFGNITFGGPLDSPELTLSTTNEAPEFGNLLLTKDAYFNTNIVTFNGTIQYAAGSVQPTGGTIVKRTGDWYINGDSSSTNASYVNATNTTYFGTFDGSFFTPSNTAKLGSGNILVQPNSAIQFNATTNVPTAWANDTILESDINNYGILRLAANAPLSAFNVIVGNLGGPQDTSHFLFGSNTAGDGKNQGSIVIAIDTFYNQSINLAQVGDGTAWLGSTGNNLTTADLGTYNGSTLGVGANNLYRLGAGSTTLYFGSFNTNGNQVNANVLTNPDQTAVSSLLVGAPVIASNNSSPTTTNTRGNIVSLVNQNYTGSTTVNVGSTFEFRGTLASTSFFDWGTLTAGGLGGTFANAGQTGNIGTVTNYPGSTLILDYSTGMLPVSETEGTAAAVGRWNDSTSLTLDNSILNLKGNIDFNVQETMGTVTAIGGSQIFSTRAIAGRTTSLVLGGLVRTTNDDSVTGNNALINIHPSITAGTAPNIVGELGSDERVLLSGGVSALPTFSIPGLVTNQTIVNGMVAPWMADATTGQFLTYTTANGFIDAGWDRNVSTTLTTATGTGVERAAVTASTTINNNTTLSVWALGLTGGNLDAQTLGTASGAAVQIQSGAIMVSAAARILDTNQIIIGDGVHPAEMIIWSAGQGITIGDSTGALDVDGSTTGQIINASSITVFNAQNLELDANQQSFAGNVVANNTTVVLRNGNTSGTYSPAGNGGNVIMNGANSTFDLRSGGSVTFTNGLVLGQNNYLVTLSVDRDGSTATGSTITLTGGLTFLGSPGEQGQQLLVTGADTFSTIINGTVDLGPAGNNASIFLSQNAASQGNLTLNGLITSSGGTASLSMRTGGTNTLLTLANISNGANNYAGGTNIFAGEIIAEGNIAAPTGLFGPMQALSNGGLGTGAITLYGGQLNLNEDGAANANHELLSVNGTTNSVPLIIDGPSTIVATSNGGGGTFKSIGFSSLTIGNEILTVNNGNNYALEIVGQTNLVGTPTFSVGTNSDPLVFNGAINDGGAGLYFIKQGGGDLWINNANSSFAGGAVVNVGAIRFGDYSGGENSAGGSTTQFNSTATLGTGTVTINPTAVIHLEGSGNVTGAGQLNMVSSAVAYSVVGLRNNFSQFTNSYLSNVISDANPNGNFGVIALENGVLNFSNPLTMSTIGNGQFFLGAANLSGVTANGTYAASSLGAGAGNLYRLGGGGGTLTVDSIASTTGALVDNSGTGVLIGAPNAPTNGTGTVIFNDNNSYTGGTVISRGSVLDVQQTSTGAGNGPLGASGTVDVFGTLSVQDGGTGLIGSLLNSTGTASLYTVNMHPGSLVVLQNNATLGATVDRWGGMALALNSSIFQFVSNGTATQVQTVGNISIAGGSTIDINLGGSSGNAVIQQSQGSTFTRIGNATLSIVDGAGSRLGVAVGTSEHVVFNGAPAPITNGQLPGYFVGTSDASFLTYGANGLQQAGYTLSEGATFAAGINAGTDRVQVTASTTLQDNPVVYSMQINGAFNVSSITGSYNTITFCRPEWPGRWSARERQQHHQYEPPVWFHRPERRQRRSALHGHQHDDHLQW